MTPAAPHPSWRIWNKGQRGLFTSDIFKAGEDTESVDVEVTGIVDHASFGRRLTTSDGISYLVHDVELGNRIGIGPTRLLLGNRFWDPTTAWNSGVRIRRVIEVGHPSPRVGTASLAMIARLAPEPHLILAAARDEAGMRDKNAQVAIRTSDGTGDHDTDGMNLRLQDGRLRAAVGYLGTEIAWNRIRKQIDLPASMTMAAVGMALSDVVALDLLDGVEAVVTKAGSQWEWTEIEFEDGEVAIPDEMDGIMEMVEKARAGYVRR